MDRQEIDRTIAEKGLDYIKRYPEQVRSIAMELMELNKDYIIVHGEQVIGSRAILTSGFTENQKVLLADVLRYLKNRTERFIEVIAIGTVGFGIGVVAILVVLYLGGVI